MGLLFSWNKIETKQQDSWLNENKLSLFQTFAVNVIKVGPV